MAYHMVNKKSTGLYKSFQRKFVISKNVDIPEPQGKLYGYRPKIKGDKEETRLFVECE